MNLQEHHLYLWEQYRKSFNILVSNY